MSRLFTMAFAMKDRIETIPELAGAVVVIRQNDLEAEFDEAILKGSDRAVIIRLVSSKNPDRKHRTPRFVGTYTVTLFCVPLLESKDATAADDLMEQIYTALHGWWPDSIPSNGLAWVDCQSIEYPDVPQYSVQRLTVESPRTSS